MPVYYVKSRYAANGRFKHLPDIVPFPKIEEAEKKIIDMGGPNKYLAIYDERGNRYDFDVETGSWVV